MTFDEQLERALDTLTGRLRDEVGRQVSVVRDELAAAVRAQPVPAESNAVTGRLADGVRAIGAARSLSEVLDTLLRCAGQEAARAGVLIVRGDRFRGWRFTGFGPAVDSGDPIDIAPGDGGVIAQAVRTVAVVSGGHTDGAPAFAQLPPGRDCMAAPLLVGGQAVAVLYADEGPWHSEPGTLNPEPLNPELLEVLTRYASRCLEALTAIKAARSLTAPSGMSPVPAPAPSEESAEEYAAARRYARLLVSEIKLYHEAQVAAGRREGDLATRLGGEIARVRALYEQRVPPEVRQDTDYVHEELIRTLADGDATLLEVRT